MERVAIITIMILLDVFTEYVGLGVAFGVLLFMLGGVWVKMSVRHGKLETKVDANIKHNNQELNMIKSDIDGVVDTIKEENKKNTEGRSRLYDKIGDVDDKITPLAVDIGEIKGMLQEHFKKNGKP